MPLDWLTADRLALAFAVVAGALGLLASGHALLNKRRPRAAFGWIALCLTFPLVGAGLYFLFGINRTRRRARRLRDSDPLDSPAAEFRTAPPEALAALAHLGRRLSGRDLVGGNSVEILDGGERAYPAMLRAIDGARRQVHLSSYIFDRDATGRAFADALGRAVARGVEARVLLDGVGELYSWPRARHMLRRQRIEVRRFLPPRLIPPSFAMNLRNHRKILVVDDELAFTGGMNVSDRHLVENLSNPRRVEDLHFAIRGPVVSDIAAAFRSDWVFSGGWDPGDVAGPVRAGDTRCRLVTDGPDDELGRLLLLLVGAVSQARRRVAIMTPYFIPPRELLGALQAAALRGVDVCIILPERSNLFFVHRATRHQLWELLERDVTICYQPGPFVHSKLLVVDDDYAQVGSANVDPRSLRLNFELMVEIFDPPVVARLAGHVDRARQRSHSVTLAEVDGRRLPTRLADGLAWLFSPYL